MACVFPDLANVIPGLSYVTTGKSDIFSTQGQFLLWFTAMLCCIASSVLQVLIEKTHVVGPIKYNTIVYYSDNPYMTCTHNHTKMVTEKDSGHKLICKSSDHLYKKTQW